MNIETAEDLATTLADWLGIYGGCKGDGDTGCVWDENRPLCCRQGFVDTMTERIIEAADNTKKVNQLFS
jgi:hypothetical protein